MRICAMCQQSILAELDDDATEAEEFELGWSIEDAEAEAVELLAKLIAADAT